MTSQFLSVYYLNKLDHYIVHDLKLKYYVRYMDDFIIISHDLDKLKKAQKIIIQKLKNEYKIDINQKKTMITNIRNGFGFLGYSFKIIKNKTIIKVKRSNYETLKKKIKRIKYNLNQGFIDYKRAFTSIMTYSHLYKYASNIKIQNLIERYFYNEK